MRDGQAGHDVTRVDVGRNGYECRYASRAFHGLSREDRMNRRRLSRAPMPLAIALTISATGGTAQMLMKTQNDLGNAMRSSGIMKQFPQKAAM